VTAEPDRARLLARIRREFDVVEERLTFGARSLAFARVADPDKVLDEVCEQETLREKGIPPKRELRMPYWAAVWESASAIGEHLAQRDAARPLAGLSALDLGCGMGMAGAVMAMLGARVVLADIDTAGLLFARLNTLPWAARTTVTRLDWSRDDRDERFDMIVGADVLYDATQWAPIEAFARRHLAPGGVLILGEPSRIGADGFPVWLADLGWAVTSSERVAGDLTVRIHEARLAAGA